MAPRSRWQLKLVTYWTRCRPLHLLRYKKKGRAPCTSTCSDDTHDKTSRHSTNWNTSGRFNGIALVRINFLPVLIPAVSRLSLWIYAPSGRIPSPEVVQAHAYVYIAEVCRALTLPGRDHSRSPSTREHMCPLEAPLTVGAHALGHDRRLTGFEETTFGAISTCVTASFQRCHARVVLLPFVVAISCRVLCLAVWPVCGRW